MLGRIVFAMTAIAPWPIAVQELAPLVPTRIEEASDPPGEIVGRVILEDENGAELTEEDGILYVVLAEVEGEVRRRLATRKVAIEAGRFTLFAPAADELELEFIRLDDTVALFDLDEHRSARAGLGGVPDRFRVRVPESRELAVRARLVPPTVLHVIDATTRAELEEVSIVRNGAPEFAENGGLLAPLKRSFGAPIAPRSALRPSAARSPVILTVERDAEHPALIETPWVGASGHAWHAVPLNFARGGRITVALPRGGTLVVEPSRATLPHDARIAVRRTETSGEALPARILSPLLCAAGFEHEGPFDATLGACFEGVEEGPVEVSVLLPGIGLARAEALATCEVEVIAGEQVTADLDLEHIPGPPAPVALTLVIDAHREWANVDFALRLEPERVSPLARQEPVVLDRDALVAESGDTIRWRLPATDVAPGRYALRIPRFGIERGVEITPESSRIEVVVPQPVDVLVRFVDARTREPLLLPAPRWRLDDGCDTPWSSGGSRAGHETSYRLRLPTGRIVFSHDGFGSSTHDLGRDFHADVGLDVSELDFAVPRLMGVGIRGELERRSRIRLERVDGRGTSVEPSFFRSLPIAGDSTELERTSAGHSVAWYGETFFRCESGDYRVTWTNEEGSVESDRRVITVREDEVTTIELEPIDEE